MPLRRSSRLGCHSHAGSELVGTTRTPCITHRTRTTRPGPGPDDRDDALFVTFARFDPHFEDGVSEHRSPGISPLDRRHRTVVDQFE